MGAVDTAGLMTAEKFVSLPVPDHGRPWNLVDGEVVVNSASWRHQEAADTILVALRTWSQAAAGRGSAGSTIDVQVDERNVYAPDVWWYSADRLPSADAPAPYPMPDLAVEVRSPSTWRHDIGAKRVGYERHGLRELWLVDTEARTVLVFRRTRPGWDRFNISLELGESEALTSPLLPSFSLPVLEVFALD